MVKALDQSATTLSQERTLNFDWGVVEPQWIVLGLKLDKMYLFNLRIVAFIRLISLL